jgi:hypothetical protein
MGTQACPGLHMAQSQQAVADSKHEQAARLPCRNDPAVTSQSRLHTCRLHSHVLQ